MRLLMLSTDKNVLADGSETNRRMRDYGSVLEELHIVIYTAKSEKQKAKSIGKNIFVYPTNTIIKPLYFFDAYRIAKKIIVNCKLKIENSVVTVQDPFETGLVGYLIKRKFGLPLQIQVHTDFLSPYFWRESLKNKIRVILGKWLVKKADGLRVVSGRVKNSLVASGYTLKPIVVLPIIYDMNRFSTGEVKTDLHLKYPDYNFIVLSASRLTKEKNIDLAIRAVSEVVKKHPQTLLLIIGEGPEQANLKSQISNLKLEKNVIFEPWTNDIVSYYRTADVFILVSNYEGGARSPAEAIASGLPVVMTDVPPAGETIIDGKNGFVVPVNDHRQLADRLIELISSSDKRTELKKQSLAMAAGFITKSVYLKLYYQALANALTKNKNYE